VTPQTWVTSPAPRAWPVLVDLTYRPEITVTAPTALSCGSAFFLIAWPLAVGASLIAGALLAKMFLLRRQVRLAVFDLYAALRIPVDGLRAVELVRLPAAQNDQSVATSETSGFVGAPDRTTR